MPILFRMFKKEESRRMRQEFWISFGKSFPRKWTLYNTKVKNLSFKFHFEVKHAAVSIDFEQTSAEDQAYYFDKFLSLKNLLTQEIPHLIFEANYILQNGKSIGRIYVEQHNVSIHNKDSWQPAMLFLKNTMERFESLWEDYQDFVKN